MARSGQEWVAIEHPLKQMQLSPKTVPGQAVMHRSTGLRVLESTDTLSDGKRYMHLSCSLPNRYPRWDELLVAKEYFLGDEEEMIQVLPRTSEYVNMHEYCFHLWWCYDGEIIGQ